VVECMFNSCGVGFGVKEFIIAHTKTSLIMEIVLVRVLIIVY